MHLESISSVASAQRLAARVCKFAGTRARATSEHRERKLKYAKQGESASAAPLREVYNAPFRREETGQEEGDGGGKAFLSAVAAVSPKLLYTDFSKISEDTGLI